MSQILALLGAYCGLFMHAPLFKQLESTVAETKQIAWFLAFHPIFLELRRLIGVCGFSWLMIRVTHWLPLYWAAAVIAVSVCSVSIMLYYVSCYETEVEYRPRRRVRSVAGSAAVAHASAA